MYWALELVPEFEQYLWRRLIVIVNEDIGLAHQPLLVLVPNQRAMYFEFRSHRGGNGHARLVLANTILALCRSPKSRLADHFQCVIEQERRHGKRLDIPDYAIDKHTRRGRAMKREMEHWLGEGCLLEPSPTVHDPYAQTAAEYWTGDFIREGDWGTPRPKSKASDSEVEQHPLFND